jgi:hypothetical protein
LAANIPRIVGYLEAPAATPKRELETSYDIKIVPLGSLRLKIIELIYQMIKLNKETIL